ncbi:hypothetical protein [Kribbella deserti]|uniref:Holliday junction resolvase n=1 Tax=Kribbella deserti TaxID=1926257 RepID=A0ABV6QDU3_9ACTN
MNNHSNEPANLLEAERDSRRNLNQANRRRGRRWEAALRDGLRSYGFDAERLRDTGNRDEGDLVVRMSGSHVVIEAKDTAMRAGPFVDEAHLEANHFAEHRGLDVDDVEGIVIVKRRGRGFRKAFVLTTVEDYFQLPEAPLPKPASGPVHRLAGAGGAG